MTVAIFPGSFDPITNGHVETIQQASRLFDRIYLVVMTNIQKKYLFDEEARFELARDAVKTFPKVEVLKRPNQLTVKVAQDLHADVIIRGLRNSADFTYERQIAAINKDLAPELETVLFMASPENSFISSSMIKEVATFNGDIQHLVPEKVALALHQRLIK